MKKPVSGPKGRSSQPAKKARQGHDEQRPARKSAPDSGAPDDFRPRKQSSSKRFDPKALSEESRRAAARQRNAAKASENDERRPLRKGKKDDPADRKKRFSREDDRDFGKKGRKGSEDRPQFRKKDQDGIAGEATERKPKKKEEPAVLMTLNKYLAHSGISSRRDAAVLIKEGKVTVNGEVKKEPGYRVLPNDKVLLEGKKMEPIREMVYVLLNKPKGFITTTEDDRGRRTVMELVQSAGVDRLYPVGRLDRNTTGVLLLTNDGDLAQKLSHPKYEARKIYQVTLDKVFAKPDFDKVLAGVELEDGVAHVDKLAYLTEKNELGLEIHSGRNRIVRRIFEALGYEVEKLDRVMYAGLTKKNLPRGKWRLLSEKEVIMLKHFKS